MDMALPLMLDKDMSGFVREYLEEKGRLNIMAIL